jgi:2-succinyl-5-enolpyruvyl-6-hydroxy-3-cyclohexene-1-carboxylate synthase
MAIDFRNTNTIWASVLVETLSRLGLTTAIICPGSRSTPMAIAFAQHPKIEAIPILDERSAAFFALGIAQRSHRPVVLVCTSGTAGANFYPAVIEAHESRVPLLVLTADRPPELRHCNAGQAIDQQKLFGSYPNFYTEIACPALELPMLAYLRQTLMHAWQRTQFPIAGVVHLNLPFRDPLAPIEQPEAWRFAESIPLDFFDHIQEERFEPSYNFPEIQGQRGLIIAGVAQPQNPQKYCAAIAHLAKTLSMPVLAEGLSPLRNYAHLNPYLISTYDVILRNAELADTLAPDIVIRIGEMPTSKTLRDWLARIQPLQYLLDGGDRNLDPLHGKSLHLISPPLMLPSPNPGECHSRPAGSAFLSAWLTAESQLRTTIDTFLQQESTLFEGKTAWLLPQILPENTPLFIANSMPIRDVESFWQPNSRQIYPHFNRGANGIDGTLSTALGIAHHHQSTLLLTGDLALLHDTNGFLLREKFVGHLTILLINNNGGGIFSMLPIAQFDPPFEEFFSTPQNIDFAQLCRTYGIEHQRIESWDHLTQCLNPLPTAGIRVLELKTDRQHDTQWRKNNLGSFARTLTL